MSDETSLRSGDAGDTGDGAGGGASESTPLQGRAAFLQNWHWELVVRLNERLCWRSQAQHGANSETHAQSQAIWSAGHRSELTLLQSLDWLRSFHRRSPFLFYNGNTFAEIARTITDALFAEFPRLRRRQAASFAAHYVAGVLDPESLHAGIKALVEAAEFKRGDRVRTLKGSTRGTVRRLLPDGRVVWVADGSEMELVALPESLLRNSI